MKSFYTCKEARHVSGASYRQIQYWDKHGIVQPTRRRARGPRGERMYAPDELLLMWTMVRLKKLCWSVQQLRVLMPSVAMMVRQRAFSIAEVVIVITSPVGRSPKLGVMVCRDLVMNAAAHREYTVLYASEMVSRAATFDPLDDGEPAAKPPHERVRQSAAPAREPLGSDTRSPYAAAVRELFPEPVASPTSPSQDEEVVAIK